LKICEEQQADESQRAVNNDGSGAEQPERVLVGNHADKTAGAGGLEMFARIARQIMQVQNMQQAGEAEQQQSRPKHGPP